MARQKTIFVSGSISNVIFYKWRDIECARAKPTTVKQTKATKQSAKNFGQAVKIARVLREGLQPLLPDVKDWDMIYRFNSTVREWIQSGRREKDLTFFNDFQFNKDRQLTNGLMPLSIEWGPRGFITLTIPELIPGKNIFGMPNRTKIIHCQLAVSDCNLKRFEITAGTSTTIDILYNDKVMPAQQVQLPFELKRGNLAIIAVALKYSTMQKSRILVKKDMKWMPAGIIDAKLL